jgi:hypothetical protein
MEYFDFGINIRYLPLGAFTFPLACHEIQVSVQNKITYYLFSFHCSGFFTNIQVGDYIELIYFTLYDNYDLQIYLQ